MHYAAQGSFIGRYLPPKREYRSHAASAAARLPCDLLANYCGNLFNIGYQ